VLLVDASLESALERAEALRLAIRQTNLTHRGQSLPAPTASFGVATYPLHGANIADFLKAADRPLPREAGGTRPGLRRRARVHRHAPRNRVVPSIGLPSGWLRRRCAV
jgi:GGDEF domain-containing protein